MALIVFGSLSGAPGVTTTVLAVAAAWPYARPLVLEADGSGGDLASRFARPFTPGLIELAADVRRSADPGFLSRYATPVDLSESMVVPVVFAPPGPVQARAGVAALASADTGLWQGPQIVLADAGRLEPGGPSWALLARADAAVVLIPGETEAVSRASAALPTLRQAAGERLHLAVTAGQFGAAEVAASLDTDITAYLPADTKAAAVLRGRMLAGKRFDRLALPSAAAALAGMLAAAVDPALTMAGAAR